MPDAKLLINLALQGGGSHGALTWGVLDRLLEEPHVRIAEISGTSAGAMNLVALAHGMARGGRAGARETLYQFWKSVSDAARLSPMQRTPWDRLQGNYSLDNSPGYMMMTMASLAFSPQMLNPFNVNPLRDLIDEMIDFDAINGMKDLRLHLCATNVRTGQSRVFASGEITTDVVMASACLPQLYTPVEIDGEAYWDGGFSANPALTPLVVKSPVRDLLIINLNPMRRDQLPVTAQEIMNRVNEISFNTSLIKELRTINILQKLGKVDAISIAPASDLRLHMIHCETDSQELSASSKMNAEWDYLQHLFRRGRIWAQDWLDRHMADIGVRPSFDMDEIFDIPLLPERLSPIREA